MIASFAVPFLGSLTSYLGKSYFEILLFSSLGMILTVHVSYLCMSDATIENGEEAPWAPVFPLLTFGFGHALFTTM